MNAKRAICLAVVLLAPARVCADDLRPEEVRQSIKSGIEWLKRAQMRDGGWPYPDDRYRIGADALATLALLNAGVGSEDDAVARGLRRVANSENQYTYNIALKIAVLAQADAKQYRKQIEDAARRLKATQLASGCWTYTGADVRAMLGRGDNSNTQFALYGLHEAARVGVKIEKLVWQKAADYWTRNQSADGGWGYTDRPPEGYGSMTAAGVASLLICGNSVNRSLEHGYVNGIAENCGRYATNRNLAAGLGWLADHFDVRRNPNHSSYHYYWLYALERAGMLSGLKYFGPHDWYREGAVYLVGAQAADGSWGQNVLDTSFALLFLGKGRRPVLVNKLAWAEDAKANLDRHDCENLVAFVGDKLGGPVSWQTIGLNAPVSEWLEAPILYFNGHEFPKFSAAVREKMRQYVEAGGTILAEACCSRPAVRQGFLAFVHETFPEYTVSELGPAHPIWTSLFPLKPGRFTLLGLDAGCRTSVIFAPTDLSCLWEQADNPGLAAISQEAFQLGANIAAYATGREPLRDKLDVVSLPVRESQAGSRAGGVQIVQLEHAGDWKPDPHVLPNLATLLNRSAGVDVVTKLVTMRASDKALLDHPVAYMTGHFGFRLSAEERDGLARYLKRGGFLFAEACCGRRAFDTSFREAMAEICPQAPLTALPMDHPIVRGSPGFELKSVEYRPSVRKESPRLNAPRLEAMTVNGRIAVVYSPYGVGCSIEGHQCYDCLGVAPEDAKKLAMNIVLFALSH